MCPDIKRLRDLPCDLDREIKKACNLKDWRRLNQGGGIISTVQIIPEIGEPIHILHTVADITGRVLIESDGFNPGEIVVWNYLGIDGSSTQRRHSRTKEEGKIRGIVSGHKGNPRGSVKVVLGRMIDTKTVINFRKNVNYDRKK